MVTAGMNLTDGSGAPVNRNDHSNLRLLSAYCDHMIHRLRATCLYNKVKGAYIEGTRRLLAMKPTLT